MPNHVHVILETTEGHSLEQTVKSWKSYSSRLINARLGKMGKMWQPEYFDHLIRNGTELNRFANYVLENPAKANLQAWKWCGAFDFAARAVEIDRLLGE